MDELGLFSMLCICRDSFWAHFRSNSKAQRKIHLLCTSINWYQCHFTRMFVIPLWKGTMALFCFQNNWWNFAICRVGS